MVHDAAAVACSDDLTNEEFEALLHEDHAAWNRWLWVQNYGDCDCRHAWGNAADDPYHGSVRCSCSCANCMAARRRQLYLDIAADSEAAAEREAEIEAQEQLPDARHAGNAGNAGNDPERG